MNRPGLIATHEANLDFVRALGVLMGLGAHVGWFLGDQHLGFFEISLLGRLGAVIFFVHSGIVNMLSIDRHIQKAGTYALFRAYMTTRCFRIYPLSMVVVSIVYLWDLSDSLTPARIRVSVFLLTTFGGSVLLYHVIEYPMIKLGNHAAATIGRTRVRVKEQAAAACGASA